MTLHDGVRRGSQVPRIESFPLYHTSAADDAIDIASAANLILDPWQEHVLRAALGEKADGRWSSFRVALVVPRQSGKNAILEARELAGLLLFGEQVIIHTAHQFGTAHNSMIALMNRLRTSELMSEVKGFDGGDVEDIRDVDGFKTGNQPSITMKNGNQLRYSARSADAARGFTGDLVILDEAYELKAAEMDALLPTMAAKSLEGNPQVWFTSSAGMAKSDLLASLREQGMNKTSDRMTYMEWSAPDDADPTDVDTWYQANPGLGVRISEAFVKDEYDTLVGRDGDDEGFKRERLGIWAKLGGESVFADGVWESLITDSHPDDNNLFFAVDVSPSRDSASISLVSPMADGTVHIEVVDNRVGTSWVGLRIKELKERWNPNAFIAIAGSAAESLIPTWKSDGARVKLIKFTDYKNACGVFFDLVTQGKLSHRDDDTLNAAVDGAKQQWTQDNASWYWSRKKSDTDITPLVAVTVALAGMQRKSRVSSSPSKPRGVIL